VWLKSQLQVRRSNNLSRLVPIQPQNVTGKAKELLDGVQPKLKITPNIMKVMANSASVLQGYLQFNAALSGGVLDPKLREEIALEVGEQNACQYCVSAQTAIGKMIGLSDAEIEAARDARSSSPEHAAALAFARQLVASKGHPSDVDFNAARAA
jgi:AhpD family alkylhydroperoxidase